MEPTTRTSRPPTHERRRDPKAGTPKSGTPKDGDLEDRPAPWKEITRRWHAVIPSVRRRWPELTYMETLRTSGDRNHLCRLISERYGVTLDEADDMIWHWQSAGTRHGQSAGTSRPAAETIDAS